MQWVLKTMTLIQYGALGGCWELCDIAESSRARLFVGGAPRNKNVCLVCSTSALTLKLHGLS